MATPISAVDSPNVIVSNQTINNTFAAGAFKQDDLNYILSGSISITGSLIIGGPTSTVGFGYRIIAAPVGTASLNYPSSSVNDFEFYINGLRIPKTEIVGFSENIPNNQTTLSFDLGFPAIASDIIEGVGKWRL